MTWRNQSKKMIYLIKLYKKKINKYKNTVNKLFDKVEKNSKKLTGEIKK